MAEYRLKTPKHIERAVVGSYKKIEDGVVDIYKKVERKFVDTFLEEVKDPQKDHKDDSGLLS